MDITGLKIKWAYTALITLIIWFALVLQFALSIPAYINEGRSPVNAVVQILSFYTIMSNILMAFALSSILLAPKSAIGRFFLRDTVQAAIAYYITVVALIYNIMLRNIVKLDGLFVLANELLHVINPILFIIYWLAFVPKATLKYRDALPWLWFPFLYFVYSIIRGALSGDYPYPFLNVAKFGYARVLINAVILLPLMWGLAALFVFIGRRLGKTPTPVITD
jgi:hypothetical protein